MLSSTLIWTIEWLGATSNRWILNCFTTITNSFIETKSLMIIYLTFYRINYAAQWLFHESCSLSYVCLTANVSFINPTIAVKRIHKNWITICLFLNEDMWLLIEFIQMNLISDMYRIFCYHRQVIYRFFVSYNCSSNLVVVKHISIVFILQI